MRILVTGGAGFIGSHLTEALLPAHEVHVLDNLSTGRKENIPSAVPLHQIDLQDEAAVRRLFSSEKYDIIFHLAAQVDVRTSVESPVSDAKVNILGLLHLLESAKQQHPWIIFASTGGAIYGESPLLPLSETHPTLPESPYGIAKLAGELYIRHFGNTHHFPFTILRLANVYGPRQNPFGEAGVVAIFTHRLLSGQPVRIYGDGEQTRDFIFVEDVVRACLAVIEKPTRTQGQTFNVGTGQQTSVNALYRILETITGLSYPPQHLPPKPGELRHNALDGARLHEATGWAPLVPLQEGLKRTASAFAKAFHST
ncbi:MAG: NAD-dependent epimerase/dehydratase family protein [Bacteroidia bacterium]|nr:NAD-dependent epimerase/dehydratase family protein [Bacteroidia bacterium]